MHDHDVGDRAVGGPQLLAGDGVALPSSVGVAVAPMRAGSEPTSGSVSRKAETWSLATLGSHSRFCSSEPNSISGSATPIDWCALSSVEIDACHTPASISALVVVHLRQAQAAVLLGHLHAERAQLLEPVEHLVGDLGLALDLERVDLLGQERPQVGQEPLALLLLGRVEPGLGVDQVQLEVAHEQPLAEAGQLPVPLARVLGDLTRFLLAHLRGHVLRRSLRSSCPVDRTRDTAPLTPQACPIRGHPAGRNRR